MKKIEIPLEDFRESSFGICKVTECGHITEIMEMSMNFYRCSRGVNRPLIEWTSKTIAKEKVSGATLTYSSVIRLSSDDDTFSNDIKYEYYNSIRTDSQSNVTP